MADRTVQDIMTTSLVTVTEADNLATIAAGLETYRFRHIPVVDGDQLVGIVSERDLLRASASGLDKSRSSVARGERLSEQTFVRSIMVSEPKTIGPDTRVSEAARLMVEGRFGSLPVVDEQGTLLGLVTEFDLLRELAQG